MKTRHKINNILFLGTILFILFGCGNNYDGNRSTDTLLNTDTDTNQTLNHNTFYAINQHLTTKKNKKLHITLSANKGGELTYIVTTKPNHGKLNGTTPNIIYIPDTNFTGVDHFRYKANDGNQDSSTATVFINVVPVHNTPIAKDDYVNTQKNTRIIINILDNDINKDGILDKNSISITNMPENGIAIVENGAITYIPKKNYYGNDKLSYTVKNNKGLLSNEANVFIKITPINNKPIATDDHILIQEKDSIVVQPLLNNYDPDGNRSELNITSITSPQFGMARINGNYIYYSLKSNNTTLDSFTYTIIDKSYATATATIIIHIRPENDAPFASNQIVETQEDHAIPIILNGIDPDGDKLNYTLVNTQYIPESGKISGTPPNIQYMPNKNFTGTDYITFKTSDGKYESDTGVITIVVTPLNDPPIANAGEDYTGVSGDIITFNASDSYDIDGNITSYLWQEGNITLSTEKIFKQRILEKGVHTVTLTVIDDHNATDSDEKVITIKPCCMGCVYPDPTQTNPFN